MTDSKVDTSIKPIWRDADFSWVVDLNAALSDLYSVCPGAGYGISIVKAAATQAETIKLLSADIRGYGFIRRVTVFEIAMCKDQVRADFRFQYLCS